MVTLACAAIAGCGSSSNPGSSSVSTQASSATSNSSSSTTDASSTQTVHLPTIGIEVNSPVGLNPLPARYTCEGADVSPPLSWGKLPPHTVEVAIVIISFNERNGKPFAAWGVTGLSPKLHGLASGALPAGAIVGRNSLGQTRYSMCPPKGATEEYLVRLYALESKVHAVHGFAATAFNQKVVHLANFAGQLSFSAKRKG